MHGRIDWPRRFEHMQQHTGQHVLSAAFDRLLQVRTVSFHLGSASSTIDLAREVTAGEIARAELEANRVVWEDRPVTIRFADAEEAARLSLRKESKREGVLRLIDVEDFDVSACGGTHVARTGAIGIIAVAGSEKFKGGTRLEFLCGGRALAGFHALGDSVAASVRLLSVLPAELPAAHRAAADRRARPEAAGQGPADASRRPRGRGPRRRRRVRRLDAGGRGGARRMGRRTASRRLPPRSPHDPATLALLVERSRAVGDRRRARTGCRDRQRRDPQADDGNVRRQGRRPAGARAGRRTAGTDRRLWCRARSAAALS